MLNKIILSLIFVSLCQSVQFEDLDSINQFNVWKQTHGKSYETIEEHTYRFSVFQENKAKIEAHNADNTNSYKKGLNQWSDLSHEEWKSKFLSGKFEVPQITSSTNVEFQATPVSVDWRKTKNVVSKVKDQGQCGSCWSFSTTGGMEGICGISTGKGKSFSEQQLVDCDTTNSGCSGGGMGLGYPYVSQNGIELESKYPYTGSDGECHYSGKNIDGKGIKLNQIASDCDSLLQAVVKQPVSVVVDANSWQEYNSGIMTEDQCGTSLDHAVLLVGYGTDGESDYWIVKNSWAATWGENGYIRLSRTSKSDVGVCGICSYNYWPTNYHNGEGDDGESSNKLMSYLAIVLISLISLLF